MNYLDLFIAIALIIAAIGGYQKGFIKSLTSLVALVAGIYFAIYFSDIVADWLIRNIDINRKYVFIAAFLLTFAGVSFLVHLLGELLDNIASLSALGVINKVAGMAVGVLKGVILMSILILLFNLVNSNHTIINQKTIDDSLLYKPVESVAPIILRNIQNLDFENPSLPDFDSKDKKPDLDKVI